MKNLFVSLLCAGSLPETFLRRMSTADFSAANKLYAEGKFADAADAYEKILQAGAASPALLFNSANAEFKAGHLGKAIAAYRQAELLSPRDAELRANLAFVRNQVQGATLRESRWQNWARHADAERRRAADGGFVLADVGAVASRGRSGPRSSRN